MTEKCGARARSNPGGYPYICTLPKGHKSEEHGLADECGRLFQRLADKKTVKCILSSGHEPVAHAFAKDS